MKQLTSNHRSAGPYKVQREARNTLIAILGFLITSTLASFSAAVDAGPAANSSSNITSSDNADDANRVAFYLAEESSTYLDLVPDLPDPFSSNPTHEAVSHLQYEPQTFHDSHQLLIDRRKLAQPVAHTPSTWQASFDLLAASRLDEKILIDRQELGTGINAGARARLATRFDTLSSALNAWEVIAIGLQGEDSLYFDPHLSFVPDPFRYKASLASIEFNAIHRSEYKRRIREQYLGVRYIDHRDSIEQVGVFLYSATSRQQAHNRMLGLQVGLDQSWSDSTRLRFSWGAKAGVFYNAVEQAGYVYNGNTTTLPLLLDCHADLAYRIFEQAYVGIGLSGTRLDDQSQTRFAWQAPLSTHHLTIVGMRMGFDYAY